MKRIRIALVMAAALWSSLALSSAAWAGPQWCEEDPVFMVNGSLVDVTTSLPADSLDSIKGSVHFDMQVPVNVTAAVVSLPSYPVPVTASVSHTLPPYWGGGKIPVVVTVSMEASKKFDHVTRVAGTGGTLLWYTYGTSTKPTKLNFSMYGL